jgi:HK97 family phage major capsid protein
MDEVMNLEASVDAAYRPGAMWMFNDTTRNEIRQLKSADSIYHWQPGAQAGDPDMLLGYPFIVNNDMADTATAEKSILFGQLSKYLIREVLGVTLVQLNERYADYHQVAFVAIMRFDGDLLDAGTNPVKHLVQA